MQKLLCAYGNILSDFDKVINSYISIIHDSERAFDRVGERNAHVIKND